MTVLVLEYSSRSKIVAVALTLALAFVLALALALILRPDTYAVPRNDPWMQMKDDSIGYGLNRSTTPLLKWSFVFSGNI